MRGIILGIDGGGTKTVCVAAKASGEILGRGAGGPANYLSEGVETARASLRCAVEEAFRQAGTNAREVAVIAAGLAGASRARDREIMGEVLSGLVPDVPVVVEPDSVVALLGATGCRPGIIVISGTGSMAWGMDRQEKRARTGGWGFILGDEGSGYDIARRGMIACLRAYDGRGPDTVLQSLVLSVLGLETTEDLIPFLYANPSSPGRIAALYPTVLEAADSGDPVARTLIEQAADALAEMAATTASKLDFGSRPIPLATAGGVFRGRNLRSRFQTALAQRCPAAALVEARFPPEVGAVFMGRAFLAGSGLFTE